MGSVYSLENSQRAPLYGTYKGLIIPGLQSHHITMFALSFSCAGITAQVVFTEGMVACHTILFTWRGSDLQPTLHTSLGSTPILYSVQYQLSGSSTVVSHMIRSFSCRLPLSTYRTEGRLLQVCFCQAGEGFTSQPISTAATVKKLRSPGTSPRSYWKDSCTGKTLYQKTSGTEESPAQAKKINRYS